MNYNTLFVRRCIFRHFFCKTLLKDKTSYHLCNKVRFYECSFNFPRDEMMSNLGYGANLYYRTVVLSIDVLLSP